MQVLRKGVAVTHIASGKGTLFERTQERRQAIKAFAIRFGTLLFLPHFSYVHLSLAMATPSRNVFGKMTVRDHERKMKRVTAGVYIGTQKQLLPYKWSYIKRTRMYSRKITEPIHSDFRFHKKAQTIFSFGLYASQVGRRMVQTVEVAFFICRALNTRDLYRALCLSHPHLFLLSSFSSVFFPSFLSNH